MNSITKFNRGDIWVIKYRDKETSRQSYRSSSRNGEEYTRYALIISSERASRVHGLIEVMLLTTSKRFGPEIEIYGGRTSRIALFWREFIHAEDFIGHKGRVPKETMECVDEWLDFTIKGEPQPKTLWDEYQEMVNNQIVYNTLGDILQKDVGEKTIRKSSTNSTIITSNHQTKLPTISSPAYQLTRLGDQLKDAAQEIKENPVQVIPEPIKAKEEVKVTNPFPTIGPKKLDDIRKEIGLIKKGEKYYKYKGYEELSYLEKLAIEVSLMMKLEQFGINVSRISKVRKYLTKIKFDQVLDRPTNLVDIMTKNEINHIEILGFSIMFKDPEFMKSLNKEERRIMTERNMQFHKVFKQEGFIL